MMIVRQKIDVRKAKNKAEKEDSQAILDMLQENLADLSKQLENEEKELVDIQEGMFE